MFEVEDTHPDNNRSLFGGGRYDGLVGLFGAEPIPTVGMAPGLTMTELFLQTHKLLPTFVSTTEVGVVVLGDALKGALKIAENLRDEGVNVEVDITGRKLDKQIKAVVKKHVPFILFIGEDELSHDVYTLKDTIAGTEDKVGLSRLISIVKDRRRSHLNDLDDLFE